MRKIVSSSSDTEQRKRKRKDKKGVQKEVSDRDSNNLGFARTNLSDRITFGPYKGQTFMEVARKDIRYFFLCIHWINEIKFFPDKLGFLITQINCDLKEAQLIYNMNIWFFRNQGYETESNQKNEIIKNIKSENFDMQLHESLFEIFKGDVEDDSDSDDNDRDSRLMLTFLKLNISFLKKDAHVVNHIESQLSSKEIVEDISAVEITQFETFELLIQYYRYRFKILKNELKIDTKF